MEFICVSYHVWFLLACQVRLTADDSGLVVFIWRLSSSDFLPLSWILPKRLKSRPERTVLVDWA